MTPSPIQNALGIKSLLGTENLSADQLNTIVNTALAFKKLRTNGKPFPATLEGKNAVMLFFEPSTRTRSSFALAAKNLKGNTVVLTKTASSAQKGETLKDTARTLQAMLPDILVLRHPSAGSPHTLDNDLQIPIINAGDGFHEHPTQALLDIATIKEFKGEWKGLRVLIIGDIAHSRVARSDIYALKTLGAKVSVCGPPTLIPPRIEELGVDVYYDLEKAVRDQDVVMVLRIQLERLNPGQIPSDGEYSKFFGISEDTLEKCLPDVTIMHPGPVNRGVELQPEVADGPKSVILNQVGNGVPVRMSVFHLLTGGEPL